MAEINLKRLTDLRCELVAHTMAYHPDNYNDGTVPANLMPVSAARVSHGREDKTGEDPDRDLKLMMFLAEHKHFSPFEHQSATFLIEAPLYVAREWMRHRTQSFNEISMRYTSDPSDTYYIPEAFRAQATKNKQSSAGVIEDQLLAERTYVHSIREAVAGYEILLQAGVAREIARGVLPTAMVTRFYATANLRNWAHWYHLRASTDAQLEIRHYAGLIDKNLSALWPEAWEVLKGSHA